MNNVRLLTPLLTFAEVAQRQSFTEAAKALGMSKSAVSQQVKRLEEHLGQQLLSRNTRGMALTAIGVRLLERCEVLHKQIDRVFEEVDSSKSMPSGPFSITLPHSLEKDVVIPALKQLCIEYPDLEPRMLVTDQALDLIKEKLDVALYFGELKDSDYRALLVGTCFERFCASPAYLQNHGLVHSLDELKNHRWIAAPWQKFGVRCFTVDDEGVTQLTLESSVKTNTFTSTVEMASSSMGVALLPDYVLYNEKRGGRLVQILPEYRGEHWALHLVHRFLGEKPVHVSRFYELVKLYFDKMAGRR